MNENVTIKCTDENYHYKYIQLKTYNLLPKSHYRVLSEITKREFIGTNERKVIREKLGMSVQSFNNALLALKQSNLLEHDDITHTYKSRIHVPEDPGEITFKFEKS